MKLSEMSNTTSAKVNKVIESRFGFKLDFTKLSVAKANQINETISKNIQKIRHSSDFHTAEKNPRYMELLTVRESITKWLSENKATLTEGDVGDAEVLLAAKDMVDSIQDVIEKVGKMQYEQLPQLTDSIRDEIGSAESDSFSSTTLSALTGLMDQLNSVRDQLSNGVRLLSGEQVDAPMAIPDGEPTGADADLGLGDDESDGFDSTDAAAGGDTGLGRELR